MNPKPDSRIASITSQFGRVCEHGSLARKCEICELRTDVAELVEAARNALTCMQWLETFGKDWRPPNSTISAAHAAKYHAETLKTALAAFPDPSMP